MMDRALKFQETPTTSMAKEVAPLQALHKIARELVTFFLGKNKPKKKKKKGNMMEKDVSLVMRKHLIM
uniref:Uncharacterized protein n=1 Tax=Kalanchoe fedtschenkoi TaxID=63787 RepID=A0A7N0TCQ0_KALFE